MVSDIKDLVKRGSATAKAGFSNEKDLIDKFNNWQNDSDARQWLKILGHDPNQIKNVKAVKVKGSHKADIQVAIEFVDNTTCKENISAKLVSNPQGFNQIDKRWVGKYQELWNISDSTARLLKLFTGEIKPQIKTRDQRRMFLDEMTKFEQQEILDFFKQNKEKIVKDILEGRGEFSASWMLIYQKDVQVWSLLPMSVVMNFYSKEDVVITSQGSLRIGQITMQRKGGDGGRKTAQTLQFKINPCKIVNDTQ